MMNVCRRLCRLLIQPHKIVLNSQQCACNQQQGCIKKGLPATQSSILAATLCPDVRTSVFMCISMAAPHPACCCFLLLSLLPPSLPELLPSCRWRQRQGEVVLHRWGWGGVRAVQPVCSRGSWVSVQRWRAWKRELPVGVSFEEINGAWREGREVFTTNDVHVSKCLKGQITNSILDFDKSSKVLACFQTLSTPDPHILSMCSGKCVFTKKSHTFLSYLTIFTMFNEYNVLSTIQLMFLISPLSCKTSIRAYL